jgi:hypothetical protein
MITGILKQDIAINSGLVQLCTITGAIRTQRGAINVDFVSFYLIIIILQLLAQLCHK